MRAHPRSVGTQACAHNNRIITNEAANECFSRCSATPTVFLYASLLPPRECRARLRLWQHSKRTHMVAAPPCRPSDRSVTPLQWVATLARGVCVRARRTGCARSSIEHIVSMLSSASSCQGSTGGATTCLAWMLMVPEIQSDMLVHTARGVWLNVGPDCVAHSTGALKWLSY